MSEYVKYLDESLSFEERAKDLVDRMTLEECASQMLSEAKAVERLGVPSYHWWNEALHGVARAGMATVFPQSIGMAATFNPELLREVTTVISTEGRAKYNEAQKKGDHAIYKGLTFWSPNVNIFRDPRWGRGQETFGEDPVLTSLLGAEFVKGLQGDDPRYLKSAGCAKHFAVHSGPENLRHEFDAVATKQEMTETYLPAFKKLCDTGVEGFMGAYNRVNGEVACGSPTLLKSILREKWGFKGYITSDCGAICDFHDHHKVTKNPQESAALAIENTCDLNCGQAYEYIQLAVMQGLVSEEKVRECVVRLMTTRMKLGMFDKETPWDQLGFRDLDTEDAKKLNLMTAREALVLLKNDGILPLKKEELKTITVCGPNADSIVALNGNYHGTANKYTTVLEAIRRELPDVEVLYSEGSDLRATNLYGSGERLTEVKIMADYSDLLIVVTGLDEKIEGEEGDSAGDKNSLLLPECQRELLQTVMETGKPYIIINMTGSAMDFEEPGDKANAVIQAWYPGARGGDAVADLLLGVYSPSGKLPVTFYQNEDEMPDFCDYSMKNRTYKFFEGTPLYPFGYGLSYTTFEVSNLKVLDDLSNLSEDKEVTVSVDVKNTGKMDSSVPVQIYVKSPESEFGMDPKYRFAGVCKVPSLQAGETKTVSIKVPAFVFASINADGEYVFNQGTATVFAGVNQPDQVSEKLSGEKSISISVEI